jgi:signal peptidase
VTVASLPAGRPVRRKGFFAKALGALGMLGAVIAVMFGAILVVLAIATHLSSNKEQYTVFGRPVLVVLSGSMAPKINTGDLIIDGGVTTASAATLHKGQIITFYDSPGSKTVINHRIVAVVHQRGRVFYRTKGDANNAADPVLRPSSDVIGVYESKIPRGGYFLTNIHRPFVLGMLLLAPILWLTADMLRRWAREEDEPKDPSDPDGAPEGDAA